MRRFEGSHSVGIAAGMEFDDSEDDFMFDDDEYDSNYEQFQAKPPMSAPETTKKEPVKTRIAPWVRDRNQMKAIGAKEVHDLKTVEHGNEKRSFSTLKLEDEEIRAAISSRDKEFVKGVIKSGFAVDSKLKSGWTCLMYAATAGDAEIIALLLDNGANANFQKDMFTPMMAVCSSTVPSNSRLSCAQHLIDAGARVNAHDRHLVTPLMFAAQKGQHELVQFLIDKKAQADAQDNRGWTALAFAAESGHAHVVKILLQNQSLVTICAYDGQSPADLAYSKGFTSLAEIIENRDISLIKEEMPTNSRTHTKKANPRYKKVGELEMFLHGLDLGDLGDIFTAHQISFQEFLKLTEDDLCKIGVTQLGARRKILEAIRGVHTNEWDLSGLTVDTKTKISTIEAAAIAANIAKHLDFMRSSISYLHDYVCTRKTSIAKDDPSTQKLLVDQCQNAYAVCLTVDQDLNVLQSFVKKEFPLAARSQCDLVDERKLGKVRTNRLYVMLPLLGCLTFLSYSGYKYLPR